MKNTYVKPLGDFTAAKDSEIIIGHHFEKTFCAAYVDIMHNMNDSTTANLDALKKNWKVTEAPYYVKEFNHPGWDVQTKANSSLLHKDGTNAYADMWGPACSTEGLPKAFDQACDFFTHSSPLDEKLNMGIASGNAHSDSMFFSYEGFGKVTVKKEECIKAYEDLVDAYSWEHRGYKNVTAGWIYTHDGNAKWKFEWEGKAWLNSGKINTPENATASACYYNATILERMKELEQNQTGTENNTGAGASNGDVDNAGDSGAGTGKQIWFSLVGLGLLVAGLV